MLKVVVPATTANLGVGYDTLGMALSLYSEFYFEESDSFKYVGFLDEFANDDNLVKKTYEFLMKRLNKEIIPLKITINDRIPIERGMGSSSAIIVAGLLAASYYSKCNLSKSELLKYAVEIEGHPDNVAPAIMGGLISSIKTENKYITIPYDVNKDLNFITISPEYRVSTKYARSVLPKSLPYEDIIHNTSRITNLPYALKNGDVDLLKVVLDDRMHEPYRMKLIKDAYDIKELALKNDSAFCISGSGSTMLVISKNLKLVDLLKDSYEVHALKVGNGAWMEEI